jgi:hypothetical protein
LGGLLIFDVNITTEKVNEKNPLEMLNYPIKKGLSPILGTGLRHPSKDLFISNNGR